MLRRLLMPWLALLLTMTAFTPGASAAEMAAGRVLGNPEAPMGGARRDAYNIQPATLHPLNATDYYGNRILELIYESLATVDLDSYAFIPLLAERWEISPDQLVFTFHLNPAARWQDGKPVTAADVKFSFDVLFAQGLKTRAKWQSYYSNFSGAEVLGPRTVRFTARQDHFRNFNNLASLRIVPAHRFDPAAPDDTDLAKQPMGSGPYRFDEWRRGSWIKLRRDKTYWGAALAQNQGRWNQSLLLTKFIPTDKVLLESFKRGDLDLIGLTPDQWVRETDGADWGEGAASGKPLVKLAVNNLEPRSYRYVGYNLGSPLFSDRRVRQALSRLYDRDAYIEKFYHGFRDKAVGPFAANSPYRSPNVQPVPYDVAGALRLLREAGWADTDGDTLLDKDGRAFRFTVLTADAETSVKLLTLARESMRQAGVELNIKVVDWSTLLQLIDEYKYDAVMLGWTRVVYMDPTPLWHSKGAVAGGLNLVRYQNPEVDRLIEAGVRSIPEAERVKIYRRIHEIIAEDQPYTFLLEDNRKLVAHQARFRAPKPWYNYALGEDYWWITP